MAATRQALWVVRLSAPILAALALLGCPLTGVGEDCGPGAKCCFNLVKDAWETDVDCGEYCKQGCGKDQHCVRDKDCRDGYLCTGPDVHSRQCRAIDYDAEQPAAVEN